MSVYCVRLWSRFKFVLDGCIGALHITVLAAMYTHTCFPVASALYDIYGFIDIHPRAPTTLQTLPNPLLPPSSPMAGE